MLLTAALVIWGMASNIDSLRVERDTYKSNQAALLADAEYWKTESGKNAASVSRLQLDKKEIEQNFAVVKRTADELGIKMKRLQSASISATNTDMRVVTIMKDSIVYVGGEAESIRAFDWSDAWMDVSGEVKNDTVTLEVESRDTLVQIVHRIPHRFWFIKWGTKAIRQEIVSSNPHTEITYDQYIELK